jgi:two-component system, LytTR family, sensor histidine kinase AlgZ
MLESMDFKDSAPLMGQSVDANVLPDPLRAPTMWAATGFGDASPVPGPVQQAQGPDTLDLCHVGVVLRVLTGVLALLWVSALFGADSLSAWVQTWVRTSAEALPATLLWLVLVCGVRRWLQTWALPRQWCAVCGLGALAGAYGHAQVAFLGWWLGERSLSAWAWAGPVVTGAVLAAGCFAWLRLRQAQVLPQQNQARLAELQARIRPHFLFNTLNTAIALVQIDPQRAEAVLEDLAELFRCALASPATRSTLAEEADLAQRYMGIEQLRFGERLSVNWQLDERVATAAVPTLLLQPLVENAVKHGVEVDPAGGWVKVQTALEGQRVVVTVSNSMPADAARQVPAGPRGHGMALRNVRHRLLLMHDVEAQFEAGPRPMSPGSEQACYVVRFSWPCLQDLS